jgi:amino acid transporter
LLAVPKTPTTIWVLILLFGAATAPTTLLTTLDAFVTILELTNLATLISLLATLILTLILRHRLFPRWDSHGDPTARS